MEVINYISDFENLPKQIQQQVLDYIEFLLDKYQKKDNKNTKFSFDWENGLSELKHDYTSVELQHYVNLLR